MSNWNWTDQALDAMRQEMDPLADEVVRAVYEAGAVDGVNCLLMDPKRRSDPSLPVPVEVRKIVDAYMDQTDDLPAWADMNKIAMAEDLFSRHGLLASVILCCASLPECYLDALDVPVLASTTQLKDHVAERILQTSAMVVSVMQPGGMKRGGLGVNHSQRVRLMHAAVRHLILQRGRARAAAAPAPGSPAQAAASAPPIPARGRPINQESMAFVILTFSYVGLRSMDRLEVAVSDEEREAYVHAWSVIGHVMGVKDEYLVHSYAEAQRVFELIKARRKGASPEGQALTAALLDWMQDEMPLLLRALPREMMCQLMDPQDLVLLGIQSEEPSHVKESFWHGVMNVVEAVVEGFESLPMGRRAAEAMFTRIVRRVWESEKVWMAESFALPPSLQESWRLPPGVTPQLPAT